ncbi:MAG: DegT/DnrJ/EryC1/StrS family aminotransferase [Chthoniobacterales bacterium]
MTSINVPFLDLKAHHAPFREEFDEAIAEVIDNAAFAGGPVVAQFETEYAAFCSTRSAIGLGSGTEALWLALLACGVGPGDEVITVASSFMATAEAISYAGAIPVFIDIDEDTYTMDPAQLEQALTPRTKAIIPVHLFGQAADMDPILAFGRQHGLFVIEDAAQAHGTLYKGRKAGSLGAVGCFSFYPGKNLGAFGEAGAVVTNDPTLDEKMRVLRDHGQVRKYEHTMVGWNCRMDGIQAAVLRIKLAHLEAHNEARRKHAAFYTAELAEVEEIVCPQEAAYGKHVYHIYAVRVPERDKVLRLIEAKGIGCGIHYPTPIHLQKAYQHLGYAPGALPVSERTAAEFLSLPMYPELTEDQTKVVTEAVKSALLVGALS